MLTVNGKEYPLWSQFVEGKDKWIGGTLYDTEAYMTDEITDITLEPNGKDSAYFMVHGKEFNCGFDAKFGGICGGEKGWISFSGSYGMGFRIAGK